VYRPAFEERHSGYYNSELWAVQPQYVEERR
jgi:hypothetical protein